MKTNSVKFAVVLVLCILIFAAVLPACSNSGKDSDAGTSGASEDTTEPEPVTGDINQSGVNLGGSVISWANMKIDNPDLQLTDDQKMVLQYFDRDYLQVLNYDNLQRYPKAYRNAQIRFRAYVLKILKSTDDEYECLAAMAEFRNADDQDFIRDYFNHGGTLAVPADLSSVRNLVVIKGKQSDARLIQGDSINCYGRYQDIQPYDIDGKSFQLPTIANNYTSAFELISGYDAEIFDYNYIRDVAQIILGGDIKISLPNGENFNYFLHIPEDQYYIVTPDKQTNANFKSFDFGSDRAYIVDSTSSKEEFRQFYVAADFQHYIVSIYNAPLKLFYLEYYDRDFNKVWGREFNNVDDAPYDYTSAKIYLVADTDLYIIDTENGEDLFSPSLVGQKAKVNVVEDGVLLIGKGNKDNVMKTDLEGNILWKTSIDFDVTNCNMLQIIDGDIVTSLMNYSSWTAKTIVVSGDGELLLEFDDSWPEY